MTIATPPMPSVERGSAHRVTATRCARVFGDAVTLGELVPLEFAPLQFDAQSFVAGVQAALVAIGREDADLPSMVLDAMERRHG